MYAIESIILLPPIKATVRALAVKLSTDKITREREGGTHDFLVVDTKDSIVDLNGLWCDLGFGHCNLTYRGRGGMGSWLKKRSSEGELYSWERCLRCGDVC